MNQDRDLANEQLNGITRYQITKLPNQQCNVYIYMYIYVYGGP